MTVMPRRVRSLVGFGLLALGMIVGAGLVWGALLYANFRTTPSMPWALPGLLVFLWAAWRYLGGWGWPAATSASRKALLRANPVGRTAFLWSIVAGLLAVGALAGFWILMVRLFPMQPNLRLPGRFPSSPLVAAAIIAGASSLAPVIEESAVRGYLQSVLERDFAPWAAVLLSSVVFAMAHASQGVAWPKLVFYGLVGVTFGALAYLNDSIVPAMPVHAVGDVAFFVCIWPFDGARAPLAHGGDAWFWGHVAQILVCGGLSLAAFHRLCRARHLEPARPARLAS